MSRVIDFTEYLLKKRVMSYSVEISHYPETRGLCVKDVQTDKRSLLAVADDLEWAAALIREEMAGKPDGWSQE